MSYYGRGRYRQMGEAVLMYPWRESATSPGGGVLDSLIDKW
jgi:hypothetical protein